MSLSHPRLPSSRYGRGQHPRTINDDKSIKRDRGS